MMYPLLTRLVERAQADSSLRADLAPTDVPLLQVMLGSLSECTRDIEPDVWRRFLTIVTDGMRTRRDEPTPLGHAPLTPEQTQGTMRAWRPGPGR